MYKYNEDLMFLKEASPTYAKMFALDCYELCLERHIENIVKQMWPLIQKRPKNSVMDVKQTTPRKNNMMCA